MASVLVLEWIRPEELYLGLALALPPLGLGWWLTVRLSGEDGWPATRRPVVAMAIGALVAAGLGVGIFEVLDRIMPAPPVPPAAPMKILK